MSTFANTPIDEGVQPTPLAALFNAQQATGAGNRKLFLDAETRAWLQVLEQRSASDPVLGPILAAIAADLANPNLPSFQSDIAGRLAAARAHAYPWCHEVMKQIAALSGYAIDHNLNCVDIGMLRQIEDDAQRHSDTAGMVREALRSLRSTTVHPNVATSQMFDVYGEAVVQRFVRKKMGDLIKVEKLRAAGPAPDFKCELSKTGGDAACGDLTFYIEVKTLDLAGGLPSHQALAEQALDRNIDLEAQLRAGKRVAIAEGEQAPWRRPGDQNYRSDSLRMLIERMIERAENVLKPSQFKHGPTFACLNLLRTLTPGYQGAALVPTAYHSDVMTCVTGLLYAAAFGAVGWQVHKRPEFEGSDTLDGLLAREGLLVNQTLGLNAAGLLVLDHQGAYRLDGLYDAYWTSKDETWSNLQTEEVFYLLTSACNDLHNGSGWKHSVL